MTLRSAGVRQEHGARCVVFDAADTRDVHPLLTPFVLKVAAAVVHRLLDAAARHPRSRRARADGPPRAAKGARLAVKPVATDGRQLRRPLSAAAWSGSSSAGTRSTSPWACAASVMSGLRGRRRSGRRRAGGARRRRAPRRRHHPCAAERRADRRHDGAADATTATGSSWSEGLGTQRELPAGRRRARRPRPATGCTLSACRRVPGSPADRRPADLVRLLPTPTRDLMARLAPPLEIAFFSAPAPTAMQWRWPGRPSPRGRRPPW